MDVDALNLLFTMLSPILVGVGSLTIFYFFYLIGKYRAFEDEVRLGKICPQLDNCESMEEKEEVDDKRETALKEVFKVVED